MRLIQMTLIFLCMGGIGAQAIADDPPATTAPASAASTDAAKPSANNDASKGATPEQDKLLRAAGYKPQTRDGHTLYCRNESTIGTRFQSKVCGTAADLAEQTRQSQEMTGSIQRKNVFNPKGN
jgi:hypothetical protein